MRKKLLAVSLSFLLLFTSCITSFSLDMKSASKFTAKPLPYSYDALEPYICKEIMILHHDKHYQTYVDNLNKTLENYPKYKSYSVEKLLKSLDCLPKEISTSVRNNGGGVYNHEFFFNIMTPDKTEVSGKLKNAIERDFNSYDNFIDEFKKSALGVFGFGWAWLVSDCNGKLFIITTANQDSPISYIYTPIIGIDVWEHAYYLQYKNKRADYIDNWINVINWNKALENYTSSLK
ncbi:superoxide dismutase [Terrisporobacter mayombei]|uniref:Superoxide dismutase n=1 Tax=Terrisporobacter mayombei TaxID=1541 RepID=A0ABY9PXM1_9FIRM|nr:superoxide dismutase [Terrisporobacter mayombei]MCC3867889.1 superoxide dismutase [Terrisporobacter mayombei]WMT80023.1 Superoxide dismutase [Mn] [Terrisporobacter mayombei]